MSFWFSVPRSSIGKHRYIFLLYKQPSGKISSDDKPVSNRSREGRIKFRTEEFAERNGLGSPVAGNFYLAEYDDYVPELHKQLSSGWQRYIGR